MYICKYVCMYVCTDIHTYIKYIYTYVYVHTLCKVYIHIEVCSAVRIVFVQHLQCSMYVHTCVTWESGLQLGYVVRWQTALRGLEHQERAPLFLPLCSLLSAYLALVLARSVFTVSYSATTALNLLASSEK